LGEAGLDEREELVDDELLLDDFPSSLSSLPEVSSKSNAFFSASFLRFSWTKFFFIYRRKQIKIIC
jgi:hypothetical protein